MRWHVVIGVILVAVVGLASADAQSDYWRKWRSDHGDQEFGGPWEFTDWVKVVPVGPAVTGQPVTVRTRAWFPSPDLPPSVRIQLPVGWRIPVPPARVKARVFWNPGLSTELLSDEMVETYIGPNDTLDATAVLRSKTGHLNAGVSVFLHYVVGGVPVMDPRRFASAPKDYWWYAGRGALNLACNPLNPSELLSGDELRPIYQGLEQAIKDRLAGAREGTVRASDAHGG